MAIPQYAQRLVKRKTSDIDRLAAQFRKSIEGVTGRQEQALGQYQAGVTEQMKPFEAATAKYQTDYATYEQQAAEYNRRLSEYESQIKEIQASPTITKTGTYQEKVPRYGLFGLAGYKTETREYQYEEPKPVPTFSAEKPSAPSAPTAPTIAAFDTSQFEEERKALQSGLQRELGERRAAKLTAASRRSSRPMMQGA